LKYKNYVQEINITLNAEDDIISLEVQELCPRN